MEEQLFKMKVGQTLYFETVPLSAGAALAYFVTRVPNGWIFRSEGASHPMFTETFVPLTTYTNPNV